MNRNYLWIIGIIVVILILCSFSANNVENFQSNHWRPWWVVDMNVVPKASPFPSGPTYGDLYSDNYWAYNYLSPLEHSVYGNDLMNLN